MILIDSNIFMYAAGAPHPAKQPCVEFLRRVAAGHIDAAIDVEVLQEILHRYWAIRRPHDGNRVCDLARTMISTVMPISVDIVDRARALLGTYPALSARDALHAAVTLHHGLGGICSYDSDFDQVGGVKRYPPNAVPLSNEPT